MSSLVAWLVLAAALANLRHAHGMCQLGANFGGLEPIAKLADGKGALSEIKSIQLTLPSNVNVQATLAVTLAGTQGIKSGGSGSYGGSKYTDTPSATGCPMIASIPCSTTSGVFASSRGWTFSTATFNAANGTLTIPMLYDLGSPSVQASASVGNQFSSIVLLLISAASAMAIFPLPRASTLIAVVVMAGYLSMGGQTTATATATVSADLLVSLFDVASGTTADSATLTFTCPAGGCSTSTNCSTSTTLKNVCECGIIEGRPFTTSAGSVLAQVVDSQDSCWSEDITSSAPLAPDRASNMTIEAERWRAAALAEHASVASFSRASLELMALGAPSSLLESVHVAALEEIRHARAAFGLARFFGADGAAPSALPLPSLVEVSSSLEDVARRTFREGCVSETEAVVRAQVELATDLQVDIVRTHLRNIVAEEAKHAALAWRTVAWAMSRGDPRVAAMLENEQKRLQNEVDSLGESKDSELKKETLLSVVLPWIGNLLQLEVSWPPVVFAAKAETQSSVGAAVHETAKAIAGELQAGRFGETVV